MQPLYKTTIVVWSEDDLSDWDVEDIGKHIENIRAYEARHDTVLVEKPELDSDYDPTSLFFSSLE